MHILRRGGKVLNADGFVKSKVAILEKLKESVKSVLPIFFVVMVICFTFLPMNNDLMLCFIIGTVMIVAGMGLFSLGAEKSMTPIGTKIGTSLTRTKNLPLILVVSFLLGFAVTVAEPDLQVLANTVPHIDSMVLLVTVGVGVGFFLAVCMLRMLLGFKFKWLLIVFYGIILILAAFTDSDFLGIAFDSGGVTTGPMTVPFILAFGIGVANIRSDKKAEGDSFALLRCAPLVPCLRYLFSAFSITTAQVLRK